MSRRFCCRIMLVGSRGGGIVPSDLISYGQWHTPYNYTYTHHYAKTGGEASCMALKDGQCDIDSGNTFYDNLLVGLAAKKCSMADVDRALFNSFRVRFELGECRSSFSALCGANQAVNSA